MLLLVMAAAAAAVSPRRRWRAATPLARGAPLARRRRQEEWVPVTKLGRLVKEGKIKSLEEIFLYSMPIKEYQIVDYFFPPTAGKLKDEVMNIKPVQKQSSAGQRTRFKAYVAVGDFEATSASARRAHGLSKDAVVDAKEAAY
ncbi:hypothetical protein JL720_9136 [Aureococcus anophagefferens]|nr:hypothetical protein JL720_9136 [Aureococcus anophagefferens]